MTSCSENILPTLQGDDTALSAQFEASNSKGVEVEIFQPGEETILGEGDSYVVHGFLRNANDAFEALAGGEIKYQQWYHMPDSRKEKSGKMEELRPLTRIKVAQADHLSDGKLPHYRFPVNNQSKYGTTHFTPHVRMIRDNVQAWLDSNYFTLLHTSLPPQPCTTSTTTCEDSSEDEQQPTTSDLSNKLNHAVVLLYRGENDHIGLHKDKTLDLEDGVPICSISLGQTRTYILQNDMYNPTKRQEITLQHGDLFVLGPATNEKWYHSIRQMTEEEVAQSNGHVGQRVSVTLRAVATRLDETTNTLTGKGGEFQTLDWPEQLKGAHRIVADEQNS
jgi:alkylated DNA repair dioxygenase AlkB